MHAKKKFVKVLKRVLLIFFSFLFILIAGSFLYIMTSTPDLPPGTDKIIAKVMNSKLPELIKGDTGRARSGNVNIWYESILPEDSVKGAVLLIMGISDDALAWPGYFYEPLVDSGYQVILYDHRGTGLSDWMENWDADHPYTLHDMADDAVAILDKLGINKAHLIGASLGGMIAQQVAIDHPERTRSLTSIMSSGYIEDPNLPGISKKMVFEFIKLFLRYGLFESEENTIKLYLSSRLLLVGDSVYNIDVKSISEEVLYNLRRRRGYNPDASKQHLAATSSSGSRYEGLKKLMVPTLIIHGRSDPFVPFEHGRKCAELIPGAETLWIKGMGHDIPRIYADTILAAIFKNINKS